MLKIRLKQVKALILIFLFKIFKLFKKKKTWVISERGTDARDNGYHFYNYLKKQHPEIKVYYIIDKKSSDYQKVKDDAVQYGSLKNYWIVATCHKLISSHYALCLPNIGSKVFVRCGLYKKFYFLQHGIIPNDLPFLYRKNAPMKLFCCGAKPEYDWVKSRFGHPENVVQYTGLARYDKLLNNNTKKQILIMPTWRKDITNEEMFLKSSFFKNWQSFLSNELLNEYLSDIGYSLIFYPHYELQRYLKHFESNNDKKNLVFASFECFDVQALLKESALLITDYSSVFFDFAYMGKPLIYFQFDKEEFFKNHYQKGYFDYEDNGFGKVCVTIDDLLAELREISRNNFNISDIYHSRISKFFDKRDEKNCERIYEMIVSE